MVEKTSTLEPDFYTYMIEMNIEGQDVEAYITFVLPLDNTKLNFPMLNDSVTQK